MNKLLALIVFSVSLMGCISSRYHEGVTEIGIPDPLPSEKHVSRPSASLEDVGYYAWLENCQAKLGADISRDVRLWMTFPSYDLEEGWGSSTPRMKWYTSKLDLATQFAQSRFASRFYLDFSADSAVFVDAVIGRFIVNSPSETTLEYLSNVVDRLNGDASSPITIRKTSEKVWESSRVAIMMTPRDISFASFGSWRLHKTTSGSKGVTFPDLERAQFEQVIPESATIGASIMGAYGSIHFEPTAVSLSAHRRDVGCLMVNN